MQAVKSMYIHNTKYRNILQFALEEEQRYKESHVILEKALIRGKYIQISLLLLSILVNILRIDKYFLKTYLLLLICLIFIILQRKMDS